MNVGDLWRALRSAMGARGARRDVDEELASHLAHRVDDLVARGVEPGEARRRAEAEFGDVEGIREACVEGRERRARGRERQGAVEGVARDVALAGRQLRREPGFAAVVILTVALGIGAATTIASVVHAVVLAPLPFQAPDRLVLVQATTPAGEPFSVSQGAFLDWRREGPFQAVGASTGWSFTLEGRGEPRSVFARGASASLLPTLGVEPLLGRGFTPDEDLPGAGAAVVVLGHALWRDAFGGDPGAVGGEVTLGGRAYRVVGVLPPHVSGLDDADLMVPLGASPASDRGDHDLTVVARLAPGQGRAAAAERMDALAAELGRRHPAERGWGVRLVPVREWLVGPAVTRAGWVLVAAAGLLLLIACVNVSNVLLARGSTRGREMAVRAALGAGRGRLTRQLLTESLVVATLGGALGLALARLALPGVRALGGGRVPRLDQAALGPATLAVCLGAVVVSAALFGVVPALRAGRSAGGGGLGERGGSGGGARLRSALVAGQVALALALLLGTGLLVRSFARLASVDPGFSTEGRLVTRLTLTGSISPDERVALMRAGLDAVEALPAVERAGATAVSPFSGYNLANFAARDDRMPADARDFLPIAWRVVTPGLVEAMGTPLLEGRGFTGDDGTGDRGEVMVNRALARALWPEGGAVGGTLVWGDPEGSRLTVVGVVEDVRDGALEAEAAPTILRPYASVPWAVMTVVVRVRGRPGAAAADVKAALRSTLPGVAIPDPVPLATNVERAVAGPRFNAVLLACFAGAGLLLALVGVYGVTAYGVSRRRREIGIRLALGGDPGDIRRLVVGQSLRVGILGVVAGAALGALVAVALSDLLYETGAADPVTWAVVPAALLLATGAASWLPARRATRVDPRSVLSAE